MPREGAIIFRGLVGKLDVLNVECDMCGRRGRYRLHRLIERYGIDAKLFTWSDEITADCPRKQARNLNDQCGARCPDLPKVVYGGKKYVLSLSYYLLGQLGQLALLGAAGPIEKFTGADKSHSPNLEREIHPETASRHFPAVTASLVASEVADTATVTCVTVTKT
jgi:hypothetical protein